MVAEVAGGDVLAERGAEPGEGFVVSGEGEGFFDVGLGSLCGPIRVAGGGE